MKLESVLKNKIFGSYFYSFYFDEIEKIRPCLKIVRFKDEFIDFEKVDSSGKGILFVYDGVCKIFYNNDLICRVALDHPFVVGEVSYLRVVKDDVSIERTASVYADSKVEAVLFKLEKFHLFPPNIRIFIAEKIFKDLTHKIMLSNFILEKYSRIESLIKSFFSSFDKEISVSELFRKVKNVIHYSHLKRKQEKRALKDISEVISCRKESARKRFQFLKKCVVPKIECLEALSDSLLFNIAEKGRWIKFKPHENIIVQGERSDRSFYIVVEGVVDVFVNDEKIAELEGCFLVGEMSLMDAPGAFTERTATIKAKTDVYAIKVDSKILKSYHYINKLQFYNFVISLLIPRLKESNEKVYLKARTIRSFLENLKKGMQLSEEDFSKLYNEIFSFSSTKFMESII